VPLRGDNTWLFFTRTVNQMKLQFSLRDAFILTTFFAALFYAIFYPSDEFRQIVRATTGVALIVTASITIASIPDPRVELLAFLIGVMILSLYGEQLGLWILVDQFVGATDGGAWMQRRFSIQALEPLGGGLCCALLTRILTSNQRGTTESK